MFAYTSRKGITYYLHACVTKGGKERYVLTRSADGALRELPAGYEVAENVNGQVSVRRLRPRRITSQEESLVQAALEAHGLEHYRLEVKDDCITLFEPDRDPDKIANLVGPFALSEDLGKQLTAMLRKQVGDAVVDEYIGNGKEKLREQVLQRTRYYPVLLFRLANEAKRLFATERMTYVGQGSWRFLQVLPLAKGTDRYLPHLGKESFFELF